MRTRSMTRAMLAGFIGTLAMTFLGFIATRFGFPFLDWAKAMAALLHGSALIGYLLLFVGGVALSMLYVHLFHDRLPGHSWRRGLFFSVLMWIVTGAALAPLLHMGFFMGSVMVSLGTLAIYAAYGVIMGFVYDA